MKEVSLAYIGHLDSLLKKFFATSMMSDFYVKMVVVDGRFCSDSIFIGHLQSRFKCSVSLKYFGFLSSWLYFQVHFYSRLACFNF